MAQQGPPRGLVRNVAGVEGLHILYDAFSEAWEHRVFVLGGRSRQVAKRAFFGLLGGRNVSRMPEEGA